MSEEFRCAPDEAIDLPFGLCTRIMVLRDYAHSRSLVESTDSKDLKMTPSIEKVLLIQAELELGIAPREED
jgi:hypothetical protein